MKCNWKTYVDNYLEGYHLPSVHPGLNRELDYDAYTVEPYARHVRQFSPIRGAQTGDAVPRRYQETREDLTTDYFWIFPNWMLNCYPDNVSLNIVLPLGTERSLAIFEWYLPEKDLGSKAASDSVEFSDQIQIEDVAICETVQKNLHSRSYERGRYSVEAGERRARVSSDVCGSDARLACRGRHSFSGIAVPVFPRENICGTLLRWTAGGGCPHVSFALDGIGSWMRSRASRPQPRWLGRFHQHAGDVIVLRGGADEGVQIAHHAAQQFIRSGRCSSLQNIEEPLLRRTLHPADSPLPLRRR